MRNIVCQAFILGIVSSLTTAEYSGSSNSGGSSDGYSKSGFISSYNGGYVGEYAGQLGAEKALGELQRYGKSQSQIAPEHGNQYNDEESRYTGAYGQNDGGHKFASSHYDGYSGNLDLAKFPIDVEAHRYTGGGGSADVGLEEEEEEDHQQDQQRHGGHRDYQSDGDGEQAAKQNSAAYNPYDKSQKSLQYKGYNDHVSMLIVPYSGSEEAAEHGEEAPKYSGYSNSQHSYNQDYEDDKAPSSSYSSSYESPKAPSYSSTYESSKTPSSSYSSSYESQKTPSYSSSYESPKAPSYSSSYESSKTPSSSYSSSYESPKAPSYGSSYESPKAPSPTYNSVYESPKAESYESHEVKYQHTSESPSKSLGVIQKIKTAGLKNFHTPLQKNIMTIDHGKGSFSYSSLYRS